MGFYKGNKKAHQTHVGFQMEYIRVIFTHLTQCFVYKFGNDKAQLNYNLYRLRCSIQKLNRGPLNVFVSTDKSNSCQIDFPK